MTCLSDDEVMSLVSARLPGLGDALGGVTMQLFVRRDATWPSTATLLHA